MTGAEIVQQFNVASAVGNSDQVLLQQASGVGNVAVKVTLEVLKAYMASKENENAADITALQTAVEDIETWMTSTDTDLSDINASISELFKKTNAINSGVVNQTLTTLSIYPNRLNVWGEITSLSVSFIGGNSSVINEYMMQFTVSGDAFTLTLPDNVRWTEEPLWTDGYTYQVSVVKNLAIAAEWANDN